MQQTDKSLDYICILGGGAVRGTSYIGVFKALAELKIDPKIIAGSSVGAVFAGLWALGYTVEELEELFLQINFELFRDIHFGFGKNFALSKGEIFLDWLRDLIEKKYYQENYVKGEMPPVTFADLDQNVIVIATDLTNFKYKEFSKQTTPHFEVAYAIRISSSMPGLMKPVDEDGVMLVDGDLQKGLPLWRLSKNLCPDNSRILEFRLEGDYKDKGHSAISYANTIYSCVTSIATDFIIETYGHRDKFDYIKINTGEVIVVDFNLSEEKRRELMTIGYNQTYDYFNNTLVIKKKTLLKYYKKIIKRLSKIKKYVLADKIRPARDELGYLYMEIYPSRKHIDLKYFDMIEKFKEEFMDSIITAPLFGFYSLKNPQEIKNLITNIVFDYESKIMELESYIFRI